MSRSALLFTETGLVLGAANIFLPFMILPVYAVVAQLDHAAERKPPRRSGATAARAASARVIAAARPCRASSPGVALRLLA